MSNASGTTKEAYEATLLLDVATNIGSAGLHFARKLLQEMDIDSPGFDREAFFRRVEEAVDADTL